MATGTSHPVVSLEGEEEEPGSSTELPDRNTCQKLVEEFASVTSTDEALAQFFLQDHGWNLEPSLNAYYESQNNEEGSNRNRSLHNDSDIFVTFDSGFTVPSSATVKPPDQFTFITWNLDGLDEHNLKKRTKAVAKIIDTEKPDIVFLQEVVPVTYSYLEEHLPLYMFVAGGTSDYFVATLLYRTTVYFDGHLLHPFPNSRMGRNLLFVDCHIGSLKLRLLNSHLESTQEFTDERKLQLAKGLKLLRAGTEEHTSIFAGDLNLRDREAMEVQIPHDVFDMWESCGQRKECKYTWDTLRNSNKSFPGKFKPRLRFDRVYLHQSDPPSVHPEHLGLVGIQKVAATQSFPSDHWGIIVHYNILNQTAITSTPPPSHQNIRTFSKPSTSSSIQDVVDIECLDVSEPFPDSTTSSLPPPPKESHSMDVGDDEAPRESRKRKLSLVELE